MTNHAPERDAPGGALHYVCLYHAPERDVLGDAHGDADTNGADVYGAVVELTNEPWQHLPRQLGVLPHLKGRRQVRR